MVGYNPDIALTKTDQARAGAVSNGVARAISQPFDVLKIRFQVWQKVAVIITHLIALNQNSGDIEPSDRS